MPTICAPSRTYAKFTTNSWVTFQKTGAPSFIERNVPKPNAKFRVRTICAPLAMLLSFASYSSVACAQAYTALPTAHETTYSTVVSDPYGGRALRIAVPETEQFRLLPASTHRTVAIAMAGQDKDMQAAIDVRWQSLPQNPLSSFRRYWDINYYVEGDPDPVHSGGQQQYWFDLDWSAYPSGQETFVRASHNFTLPHLAYDADNDRYVEITQWVFVENRTLQLYDGGNQFSGTVDVDNVTLHELANGTEHMTEGTFANGITGWVPLSTPAATLSAVDLPAVAPIYAADQIVVNGTDYSMVPQDPQGGSALRIDVPETHQLRVYPASVAGRSLVISTDGQDRTVHANIDVRWPTMPNSSPGFYVRYWDVRYHVAGNPTPVNMTYSFDLDWTQHQQSSDDFVRTEHTFTLPYQVYNYALGAYEEITHWEFFENRTIQVYDSSTSFSGTLDVDNVTFRDDLGSDLMVNGGFDGTTSDWVAWSTPNTTKSLVTWDEVPANYVQPNIASLPTQYSSIGVGPDGGFAMRMTIPQTHQTRLRPAISNRTHNVPMLGSDRTMEASIDLRWRTMPVNLPGFYVRYWDARYYVEGDPNPVDMTYSYALDWSRYSDDDSNFTRATHTFTLPHQVYNQAIGQYEEIEHWELIENRTVQLYDAQTPFSGIVDVDNITLRELPDGEESVRNGEISGTIAGWFYEGTPAGTLELLTFPRIQPAPLANAATLLAAITSPHPTDFSIVAPPAEGGYCARVDFQNSPQVRVQIEGRTESYVVSTVDGDQTVEASIDIRWETSLDSEPDYFQRYWNIIAYVEGATEPVELDYAFDLRNSLEVPENNFVRATHRFTLPSQVTIDNVSHTITHWQFFENRSIQIYDGADGDLTGSLCVDNISFRDEDGQERNFNGDFAASTGGWLASGATISLEEQEATTVVPLPSMHASMRVVLDEPDIHTDQNVSHSNRLVDWLGGTDGAVTDPFERMATADLVAWMTTRISQDDAYGSVLVIPAGWAPDALLAPGPLGRALWFEYIKSGGRIVYVGGIPLLIDTPSGQAREFTNTQYARGYLYPLLATKSQWGGTSGYWNKSYTTASVDTADPDSPELGWYFEKPRGSSNRGLRTDALVGGHSTWFSQHNHSHYETPAADSWFRNISPHKPWSGLVRILQGADYADDSVMADVYRAASFVGSQVTVPDMPQPFTSPAPPSIVVTTQSSGIDNRREFVQGENLTVNVSQTVADASAIEVSLFAPNASEPTWTSNPQPISAISTFPVATEDLAPGEYALVASVLAADGTPLETSEPQSFGVRVVVDSGFYFEAYFGTNHYSPKRVQDEAAQVAATGMGFHLRGGKSMPETFDGIVRSGKPFSIFASPNLALGLPTETTDGTDPREPFYNYNSDGSPTKVMGISHVALEPEHYGPAAMGPVVSSISLASAIPSFSNVALCNDDFSVLYGGDYNDRILAAFNPDGQGLDAPREAPEPALPYGQIPDGELWSRWWRFHLTDVAQAFNAVEMDAAKSANSDILMGPVPGPMTHPLIAMWNEPNQYPVYNFGGEGFNLISSYYYSNYGEPPTLATYWMDIGRMGHRSLPEWITPEMIGSAALLRNRLFHFLAGGVHGMSYFQWKERTQVAWDELATQSAVIASIGPTQATLVPARRRVGLVHSFTTNVFDSNHARRVGYAYTNVMKAGYDVEPVAEEEIIEGRGSFYDLILLHDVKYLPASAMTALTSFASGPGTLVLDSTVPFDIPGAVRITPSLGDAYNGPGSLHNYGRPDRISAIRDAVQHHLEPAFESLDGTTPDFSIVATNFESGLGANYTWFVDTLSSSELLSGHLLQSDYSHQGQVNIWEQSNFSNSRTVTIRFPNDPGTAYDLTESTGTPLPVTANGDHYEMQMGMQRLGGRLVAWTPQPLTALTLKSPTDWHPGQAETITFAASLWMGETPAPDGLPLNFVLLDPKGNPHPLSQRLVTKQGSTELHWKPAPNTMKGLWTIEVTDGAAGLTQSSKVRIRPRPRT